MPALAEFPDDRFARYLGPLASEFPGAVALLVDRLLTTGTTNDPVAAPLLRALEPNMRGAIEARGFVRIPDERCWVPALTWMLAQPLEPVERHGGHLVKAARKWLRGPSPPRPLVADLARGA